MDRLLQRKLKWNDAAILIRKLTTAKKTLQPTGFCKQGETVEAFIELHVKYNMWLP